MKWLLVLLLVAACTRPSEQRAEAELVIGHAAIADASVDVAGGLAAVREFTDRRVELWSQTPDLRFQLVIGNTATGEWTIVARNIMADAVLTIAGTTLTRDAAQHPTVGVFHVTLPAGTHELRIAPPDADIVEAFRVASMADIQTALPIVDDVFEVISAVPDARFVIGMGDITDRSYVEEYELFERQLTTLTIPFYSTLGNHELWADYRRFHERYGRASFQFEFKGAVFTFADSGDAGLDPLVEEWLDGWLASARDRLHIFLTHFPPIDPVGIRYGGFRSEQDGRRLLARLVEGNIDLTLYGHIHTFIQFENAGIPAYISGGGGAEPMRWDGIDRHFLIVDIEAGAQVPLGVELRRVD